jgi:hypothetical protein
MSNLDTPFGLRAYTNQAGTAPQMHEYTAASSVTVYEAAPMMINTTGQVSMWDGATTTSKRLIGGSVHGKNKTDTDRKILIYDDPTQEYVAQVDDASVTILGALVGRNFKLVNQASGVGTTLQSIGEIDGNTGTTTVTTTSLAVVKGLRFHDSPDMDQSTTWTKVVVKFNPYYHIFAGESTGV